MKSKKGLIALIAILSILIISGGVFAILWFFTGVFNFLKPTNDVFANQLEKAFNLEGAKFAKYSDFLKDYKEMSEKSSKTKMNLSANLNIDELDSDVQKTINKSKLTMESNTDAKNKKTQNKIGLYAGSSEVLSFDLVTNDSKIGIGCKDLYNNYLTATPEDFAEYVKKSSSDVDSEELEAMVSSLSSSKINPYDLLYISDSDLKHFDDRYGDILKTLISKDCYTTEKDVEVEVDDKDVKTTAYYLTLTGKDAAEFANGLSKLVKEDDVLVKIITEKANMLLASSGKTVSESEVKDTIEELTKSIEKSVADIEDKEDSAIQIAIYSKDNEPVRVEFNAIEDVEKKSSKETLISIEYAKNKQIYTLYNDGTAYITLENNIDKQSKEELKGTISIKMAKQSLGTINYEFVNKESESKINVELNIPIANVSGSIVINTKGNYKKEAVTFDGKISFKYQKQSATISFDGSSEFVDSVSIPDLTSSNSTEIFKLSDDELEKELSKIQEKAAEVLPNRLKLIGIDIDSKDILPTKTDITTDIDTSALKDIDTSALKDIDTSALKDIDTSALKALEDLNLNR